MINDFKDYHKIKGWQNTEFASQNNEPLIKAYAQIIKANTSAPINTALDFGFGNGEMLLTLRKLQVKEIFGVEVNPLLVAQANRSGFTAYETMKEISGEQLGCFDLILAMHVLEHIKYEELHEVFYQFEKLLKPGGCIIAAFPNGESPFSNFAFNSDPTHKNYMSREKCRIVALEKSFDLVSYKKFPAIASYSPRLLKRILSHAREFCEWGVFSILAKLIYGNDRVLLNPVAIAVWRRR